jgi:hypothetical protein
VDAAGGERVVALWPHCSSTEPRSVELQVDVADGSVTSTYADIASERVVCFCVRRCDDRCGDARALV